jgi:hypothetical protein
MSDLVNVEDLRSQMIKAFTTYVNFKASSLEPRFKAWTEYCQAREAYLAEAWGENYLPLHLTLRSTGPYD